MNIFVRRVLGETDDKSVGSRGHMIGDPALPVPHGSNTARDFILNSPPRPEIETRYEQVFWDILRLTTARCRSRTNGPLVKIKIWFNRAERPEVTLGYMRLILRDLPKEFGRRVVPRSTLMWSTGDKATLTFTLEPGQ